MKKILCIALLAFAMSACSGSKKETLVCESSVDNEQIQSSVKQSFEFEEGVAIKQKNETKLQMPSADGYDRIKSIVNEAETIYKDIKGAKYSHVADDATFTISEVVELDIANMKQEDLVKVISYDSEQGMSIEHIKEALETQGYTCKK